MGKNELYFINGSSCSSSSKWSELTLIYVDGGADNFIFLLVLESLYQWYPPLSAANVGWDLYIGFNMLNAHIPLMAIHFSPKLILSANLLAWGESYHQAP